MLFVVVGVILTIFIDFASLWNGDSGRGVRFLVSI
jgi:hypothetical protein